EIGVKDTIVKYFDSNTEYETYLTNEYIPKRISNNIFLKGLMPPSDRDDSIEQSNTDNLKEVRVLPKNFKINALISTWDDYTGFYSQESGTIICVRIKDKLITELVNQMFDLLFDQLPNSVTSYEKE